MALEWTKNVFDEAYMENEGDRFSAAQTQQEAQRISTLLQLKPGQAILDLACGRGRHSIELAKSGFGPITGLDFVPSYIQTAQQRAKEAGVGFRGVVGDMRQLGFEAEFDAVYNCFNSMFYWDDLTHLGILEGVYRALKPGGRFYIEVYNRESVVFDLMALEHPVLKRVNRLRQLLRRLRGQGKALATKVRRTRSFDPVQGTLTGFRSAKNADGSVKQDSFSIRLYAYTEIVRLLGQAGFELERAVSIPDGGTYHLNSPRIALIAHKPG